ncbi:MAG: hypothetical protein J0H98_08160 [Solirubrobacterales bacterium]|nr:hypothetical protein [Solirubrobacterales bacterium]
MAGDEPPCWIEPRNGVPAPGEISEGGDDVEKGDLAVLGLWMAPGIPQEPFVASTIRHSVINIEVRVKKAPIAIDLENEIRHVLNDKVDWTMGGLHLIDSLIYREMQPLGRSNQAFTYDFAYGFHHYVTAP